jgi:lipid-binding SYLF domain-containing protein
MQGLAVALGVALTAAEITPSQTARLAAAAGIVQNIASSIPANYWSKARCVAVIPDLKKAAFIVGGEYGKGVMSCRTGDAWSAPMFIQLAKGSWGFQMGAEEIDVVLLVMNEEGVQKLLDNKITLGADASVAAGPVGRRGQVDTDAALTAEIVSYSSARGLFAGIDLSGGVLRPDTDANTEVYGTRATSRTILASREISAPTEAHAFLAALRVHTEVRPTATIGSSPQNESASASRSTARPTTAPPTDDDLRGRIIDIQQTLDRMLADTTPDAAGAAGPARGTVTVDRARLLQMRTELDALLAALNRR